MLVGYARTSTVDQEAGFEDQQRQLAALGCEQVFAEQVSALAKRDQLEAALTFLRAGDSLVVTKADRLARSTADLLAIVERVRRKGAGLRILSMGGSELDTASATGKLMLTMLAAVAEFERTLMLERQREGIRKARESGKYRGRVPTARRQAAAVLQLVAQGRRPAEVCQALRISESSYYRIIRNASL
jgi:DNA invertase Pin-like site-specific DNA recombinase